MCMNVAVMVISIHLIVFFSVIWIILLLLLSYNVKMNHRTEQNPICSELHIHIPKQCVHNIYDVGIYLIQTLHCFFSIQFNSSPYLPYCFGDHFNKKCKWRKCNSACAQVVYGHPIQLSLIVWGVKLFPFNW